MTTSTILSDNGVSSGVSGLKTSAGNDGTLQLQTTTSGGIATTAVTIGIDQSAVFTGWVQMPVYTVSTLPAAGTKGRRAFVSNALTPVVLSAVVGGGAVTVPVYDNGSSWIVG